MHCHRNCISISHDGYSPRRILQSSFSSSCRSISLVASLIPQLVKNLPAAQESWVWSLRREDPLEKETANHSSILAWEIPWTEESGGLQSMGSQEMDTIQRLNHHRRRHRSTLWLWAACLVRGNWTCISLADLHLSGDSGGDCLWVNSRESWKRLSIAPQFQRHPSLPPSCRTVILNVWFADFWGVPPSPFRVL